MTAAAWRSSLRRLTTLLPPEAGLLTIVGTAAGHSVISTSASAEGAVRLAAVALCRLLDEMDRQEARARRAMPPEFERLIWGMP